MMQIKGGAAQVSMIGLMLIVVLVLRPRALIGEEAVMSHGAEIEAVLPAW